MACFRFPLRGCWRVLATCVAVVVIVSPAVADQERRPSDTKIEERIASIEDALKPLVVVTNRPRRGFSLEERMRHYNVPGVSIAVIHRGELEWARGYGVADLETQRTVNAKTLFRAASISKPVAAAGALCLVDRGSLDLDAAVNRQLVSWLIPSNDIGRGRDVTLRLLLSHTGGLSDDPQLSFRRDEAIPTLVQILDGVEPAKSAPVTIEVLPGAEESYSNQGFCVIQLLMSDVTGLPFPDLMRNLVLVPVGMNDSTFDEIPTGELLARTTTGYFTSGEELPGKQLVCPALAAAGLWTTPTDLANFALALTRSFEGEEGALLNHATAEEMLTPRIEKYGLGLSLEGEGDQLCFSHGGASEGYRCFLLDYPRPGDGAVIMTNSDGGQGLYFEIIRALASEYEWPGYQPVQKTIVSLTGEDVEPFEGSFLLDERLELGFAWEEDHLRMDSPSSSFTLYPESAARFFDIDFGFTVEFSPDASGVVNRAVLDRGGVLSTLSRVD